MLFTVAEYFLQISFISLDALSRNSQQIKLSKFLKRNKKPNFSQKHMMFSRQHTKHNLTLISNVPRSSAKNFHCLDSQPVQPGTSTTLLLSLTCLLAVKKTTQDKSIMLNSWLDSTTFNDGIFCKSRPGTYEWRQQWVQCNIQDGCIWRTYGYGRTIDC